MEIKVEDKKIIKSMNGTVISSKMDKTVVVLVEYKMMHPLYKKYLKRSKKFKAHDENNSCKEGDYIRIDSCRPISKDKCWVVKEIYKSNVE
jgi:small subunit ribosomal protein S17